MSMRMFLPNCTQYSIAVARIPMDQPGYTLAVRSGEDGSEPIVCVAAKPKQGPIGFQRWVKGFEIVMSIYLLQPCNSPQTPRLLSYIGTMSNLAEGGGNWARYDETFRAMRVTQGWQWDLVHWELWLNAQASRDRWAGTTRPSLPGKGIHIPSVCEPTWERPTIHFV